MIVELSLFVLTFIVFLYFFRKDKNLPPGPWEIPLLGNPPVLTVQDAEKLRQRYGDLFTTRFGAIRSVFIADFKKSKEMLSKAELADRLKWEALCIFEEEIEKGESGGIVFSNGLRWHNTRRFLLRNLRDLGMGKSKIEDIIMREVEELVENFKSLKNEPSELPFSINVAVLNAIWQLVASHRYEFSAPDIQDLKEKMEKVQEGFFPLLIPECFPLIKYILPKGILDCVLGKNRYLKSGQDFINIVQPFIDDHLAKLDPNNPTDLMDEYLIEMKQKKSKEFSHFSHDDLIKTTFDLFSAGNDTTATMIGWVLFYMAKFPQIQRKVYEQIDEVVPFNKLPGLEHRERLAYLDASINEVQRHCSMIPFGVFRRTNQDVTMDGYHIPKNTMIQSFAAASHRDPTYWENPDEVDPTRFLDSNGKFISQRDGFQPFGLGKRQCIGEQFARMELFLFTAALLQTFTFSSPEGEEVDITPKIVGGMHKPQNAKLSIKLRH